MKNILKLALAGLIAAALFTPLFAAAQNTAIGPRVETKGTAPVAGNVTPGRGGGRGPEGDTPNAPTAPARLPRVTITRDVVYGHKAGMALTYDVFRPANANGTAVINMISGGWTSTWTAPENRLAGYQQFFDKGITVIALHHGSQPQWTAVDASEDVRRGVRHIKLHARDYRIDPNRMGTYGRSAGGHLSLVVAMMADDGDANSPDPVLRQDNHVKTVVAWFPPTDLRMYARANGRTASLTYPEGRAEQGSPALYVDDKDPPCLILTGDADTTVPIAHSRAIVAEFEKHHIEHVLTVYPGANHGFTHPTPGRQAELTASANRDTVAWFVAHL